MRKTAMPYARDAIGDAMIAIEHAAALDSLARAALDRSKIPSWEAYHAEHPGDSWLDYCDAWADAVFARGEARAFSDAAWKARHPAAFHVTRSNPH